MMVSTLSFARICGLLVVFAGCQRSALPPVQATERGMAIESAPFELKVTPRVRGSREATLRSGDKIVSRDRIKITASTSVDAHLYLGYCDRDRRLAFHPKEGSIEAKAGAIIYAPNQNADIKLDDQVGPEVLYVIASRRRLDLADPELAKALSEVRPGAADADCGPALEQLLAKRGPARSDLGHGPKAAAGRTGRVPPPVELDRGGYISWTDAGEVSAGGDRDGIVVVRYNFIHVDSLATP